MQRFQPLKTKGLGGRKGSPVEMDMPSTASLSSSNDDDAYMIILLLGGACVLPWTAITSAADYFNLIFKGFEIEFWFALCTMGPMLIGLALMAAYGHQMQLNMRMRGSVAAMCVAIAVLAITSFSSGAGWALAGATGGRVALAAVAACSLAVSVLQSSVYGAAGVLGPRHLQAVAFGMGWCELGLTALRFAAKGALSARAGGAAFLSLTLGGALAAAGLVRRLEALPAFARVLEVHDHAMAAASAAAGQEGGEPQAPPSPHARFGNKKTAEKREQRRDEGSSSPPLLRRISSSSSNYGAMAGVALDLGASQALLEGTGARRLWGIFLQAWQPLVILFWIFLTCLAFFPGVVTSFKSRNLHLGSWFPVIMVFVYCIGDIIGKGLPAAAPLFHAGNLPLLWGALGAHLLFFPLFWAGLRRPGGGAVFGSEGYRAGVTALLGLSTGYTGASATMVVPQLVDADHAEQAAMLCPFFIISGLLSGSIVALEFFSGLSPS